MAERFNFDRIKDFVGQDNETIVEMINIFLHTVPESLQLLNESFQNKDYRKLSYHAHKLKSSIDLLNIEELTSEIREVENAANKLENMEELPGKVDHLNNVLSELLPEIQAEMERLKQ